MVVVANSPPGAVEARLGDAGCVVLDYEGNGGTARGFNRGIRAVLNDPELEYVLLLDQDSRAPDGLVAELVAASQVGCEAGLPIGAVAPLLGDVKNAGRPQEVHAGSALVQVETLASSGTLVHRDVLAAVGLMDERLFIDAVDHEWCLRAASQGLGSYVAADVKLTHNMGDRFVWVGGRPRLLHSNPVRHYYIIRNSLLLLRRPYLPRRWRRQEFARTLRRLVGYALLSDHRARSIGYMARALADAALDRSGPLRAR